MFKGTSALFQAQSNIQSFHKHSAKKNVHIYQEKKRNKEKCSYSSGKVKEAKKNVHNYQEN